MEGEQPVSARDNWSLWKVARQSSIDEIEYLIFTRMKSLKYEKDFYKRRDIKMEISILSDSHYIKNKQLHKERNLPTNQTYDLDKLSLNTKVINLINILGYNRSSLYKENAVCILDKIKLNERIDDDILTTCIVKEVLDFYNANYNEDTLLEINNIPETKFYEKYITINMWCKKFYWVR